MPFVCRTCPSCGVPYMVTQDFYEAVKRLKRAFYCPNGHGVQVQGSGDADPQSADLQHHPAATQLAGDETARRIQAEEELAKSALSCEQLTRERDDARAQAQRVEERSQDAENELVEVRRAATEREEQHALELAALQALADRQRAQLEGVEIFKPSTLAEVEVEGQAVRTEAWRDEEKECPECHKIFKPEPRHKEHHWRKKKYCSTPCTIAANQRRAEERRQAQTAEAPGVTGLEVPLAGKPVDESKPEPETSPPPDPVIDGEKDAPGRDEAPEPKIVHQGEPPQTPSVPRRLPDSRQESDYQPIQVGETLERLDNGTCDCGRPLNAFKQCAYCIQRQSWLEGQGKAKVGLPY